MGENKLKECDLQEKYVNSKSFISLTFEGHLYYRVTVVKHGRVIHSSTTATKSEEC